MLAQMELFARLRKRGRARSPLGSWRDASTPTGRFGLQYPASHLLSRGKFQKSRRVGGIPARNCLPCPRDGTRNLD